MCGFLTSSILIDEVSNYTGVILRIARFDMNCPLFTCLDFWHRLSSIQTEAHLVEGKENCCVYLFLAEVQEQNTFISLSSSI